jgi:hypothetical protein
MSRYQTPVEDIVASKLSRILYKCLAPLVVTRKKKTPGFNSGGSHRKKEERILVIMKSV